MEKAHPAENRRVRPESTGERTVAPTHAEDGSDTPLSTVGWTVSMNRQVSWLRLHRFPPPSRSVQSDQWHVLGETRPIQWRDRAGFAPVFPF